MQLNQLKFDIGRQRQKQLNAKRALTPAQKEQLWRDNETLKLLIPYFEFLLKNQWKARIVMPMDFAPVVDSHMTEKERDYHFPLDHYETILHIRSLLNVNREGAKEFMNFCASIEFKMRGIPIQFSDKRHDTYIGYATVHKDYPYSGFDIANGFDLDAFKQSRINAIVISYLYLLDVESILQYDGGKGHIIQRFFNVYPTKTANGIISSTFYFELDFLIHLALDNIDFETLAADAIKQLLAEYTERKKAKLQAT